jgi:hypothetical protein
MQSVGIPQNWLARVVAGILAAALIVLAVFFFSSSCWHRDTGNFIAPSLESKEASVASCS